MKTRIGFAFFLCLVVTVVLVKAQDDATEITDIVDTDVDVVKSDIAQIEDVKQEEEEVADEQTDDNDDYDNEETEPAEEEVPTSEIAQPAVQTEDEIIEEPVESIREVESVEEIATNNEETPAESPKPAPKSRSGNYQYGDEFFGNLDTFNTDGGYNGGGDPNYNYGELNSDRSCLV